MAKGEVKDLPVVTQQNLRWAAMVRSYWEMIGYEVKAVPCSRGGWQSIRSDMINGLPRGHPRVQHLVGCLESRTG